MKKCAVLFFLLTLTTAAFAGGPDAFRHPERQLTDRIIVSLFNYEGDDGEAGISEKQISKMETIGNTPLRRIRKMSGNASVLALPQQLDLVEVAAITEAISSLPMVRFAVPDRIMHPMAVPTDPMYTSQWHYYEPVGGINLPAAWDTTTGSSDIVVAVIDTGILGDHEDISGRWVGGYDFISMRFNARDRSRRDPDPSDEGDWNFVNTSSWHGSHVAGTIAAKTNNNVGGAGIDWQCKVLPVRVLGPLGGFTSDIIDGMRWAAGYSVPGVPDNMYPAHIINLSLGGNGTCDPIWQDAIDEILDAGTVVVIAAGNSGSNASGFSPGNCQDVITVAATDRSGDLAWYSNYGSDVEISAPGGDTTISSNGILSTVDSGNRRPVSDDYDFFQGTSMATPHVSGVIALMLSMNPDLTPQEILTALQESARSFPDGTDCKNDPSLCGAGILDAAAAVQSVTD